MNSDKDSEVHFIVDEDLIELDNIIKELNYNAENPDLEKNKLILEIFMRNCVSAVKQPALVQRIPKPAVIKEEKKEEKPTIIEEVENVLIGKEIYPIPSPGGKAVEKFEPVPKYKKEKREVRIPASHILLIQDNITNKPLALGEINDRYIIREPAIDEKQISILREIIERKPESPEQSWDLLKQLSPDLNEEQMTNLKYYIVNSLFALGRLEPLLHDPKITNIFCDGVGEFVRIKRDNKVLKTNILFKDKEDLDTFIIKLANKLNKALDQKNPVIDAVHRNYRFSIILGLHGASSKFTIKKVE